MSRTTHSQRCKAPCLLCDVFDSAFTAGVLLFLIVVALTLLCADLPWESLP